MRPSEAAAGKPSWFNDDFTVSCRHEVSEERKVSSERTERMRMELESLEVRLEEERKRSADLLLQVALASKKNTLKMSLYIRAAAA